MTYPGAVPLDTDILQPQRNVLEAFGFLLAATIGAATCFDGLTCAPTDPASLTVTVGPGSCVSVQTVDATAYGSLAADTVDPLVKMGINLTATSFTLTAPGTSGDSQNYLIEAAFSETDTGPTVLPYYDAADPSEAYSGPSNSGTSQNTERIERVALQLKEGAPAPAETQTTPDVDSGWTGLWIITVASGATAITSDNIATYPGAPFIPFKLLQLRPGFSNHLPCTETTNWTCPFGVTQARFRGWGAGGIGGIGGSASPGGGGGGGGYFDMILAVTAGQVYTLTPGQTDTSTATTLVSNSSTLGTAGYGANGTAGSGSTVGDGGAGGTASGTDSNGIYLTGATGRDGIILGSGSYFGGDGGAAPFGGTGAWGAAGGVDTGGNTGNFPGGAGSGGIVNGTAGAGANGFGIIEW